MAAPETLTRYTPEEKAILRDKAIPKKWDVTQLEEEFFKAFERGEDYQKKKIADDYIDSFHKNLTKATSLSENIFHTSFNDYGVKVKKVYLRPNDTCYFESLFLVATEDYLSDKMLDVYRKSAEITANFNDPNFRIDFKFMSYTKDLNIDRIHSDGFSYEYGGEQLSS